jgi:hypothetical protein
MTCHAELCRLEISDIDGGNGQQSNSKGLESQNYVAQKIDGYAADTQGSPSNNKDGYAITRR